MNTEKEKSSLLTVIRLLNEEQENVSCTSKKHHSLQGYQTRNSWRVADTKTKSRSIGQQIGLQNKYSTLQIENDEEAEKSNNADNNNQSCSSQESESNKVPREVPVIDLLDKSRLTNSRRKAQNTKKNFVQRSYQRETGTTKQQCEVALVGDSMIKYVDVRKLRLGTNKQVTARTFPGCRTDEMSHYIKPTLALKPKQVIIHIGTNDLKTKSTAEITRNLQNLGNQVKQDNPRAEVLLSQIITRSDDTSLQNKLPEVNKCMRDICEQENWGLIDDSNITNMHLNPYGLHLNKRGSAILAKNIKLHIANNVDDH